jgi:hypothetical protein
MKLKRNASNNKFTMHVYAEFTEGYFVDDIRERYL